MVHSATEIAVITKRFDNPDEVREFAKGRFELVNIGGMTIGRATYEPGWKWSVDVGPGVGSKFCSVEHLGLVLEGTATWRSRMEECGNSLRGRCSTFRASRTTAG